LTSGGRGVDPTVFVERDPSSFFGSEHGDEREIPNRKAEKRVREKRGVEEVIN